LGKECGRVVIREKEAGDARPAEVMGELFNQPEHHWRAL
jgi:hypothetical protein